MRFFFTLLKGVFEEKGFSLFILFICVSHCLSYKDKTCSVLYSEENFRGQEFSFQDQDQSVNILEDHRAGGSGWNGTGSIRIVAGCKMEVCNETYLDGTCHTLTQGEFSSYKDKTGEMASASCTCVKECKCMDVTMKKSSCAKAFLKGGCKTCNSMYTDLIGEEDHFPEEFIGKVEALRIRIGCTLTLYSEENFEGEEDPDTFDVEVVEDYNKTFNSYQCECTGEYEPPIRGPRPASFPPLISIPKNMEDVIKMLKDKQYSNHPGLRSALKALNNKRSSKNAYILLMGATGAGKSSAINLLFDNPKITKTGDAESTTTDIHEFRIPVAIDELGIENSELRVIDTPGLGDTRGLDQDAKFLATLDSFLSTHEELKNRIPNVVLIFHKFNDNRFSGVGSNFVKMLRGFDSFRNRITDESFTNIIFVLSHFCAETVATKRRPDKKINQFMQVIRDFSLFPKPTLITVAENKPRANSLPMFNGFFKLPNNEYYPRNLFTKMELVTENGGDDIGLGVFRTAFRNSEDFNVSSKTFNLLDTSTGSDKISYYLGILSNAAFGVEETEISLLLQKEWGSVDSNLRKKFPGSLSYLQKSLNMQNVNTKEDVPKTMTEILELLQVLKNDEATLTLLDKALNIKPPEFPHNTIAGRSYNVFKDTYLPSSPFDLATLQQSDIGFMLPKILTCKLERSTKENFFTFEDIQAYVQSRIQSLGIEGHIAKESFTAEVKLGNNIRELSFKPDSCSLSATREFRLFEFVLNDRLDLTKLFQNTVKSLPAFNESNHETVERWNNFFNEYGTHVVKSVYGGGSINIKMESDQPFNEKLAKTLFHFIRFAEDTSVLIEDEQSEVDNSTIIGQGISHVLTFTGGHQAYHTTDLTKMSVDAAVKLLSQWKKSLKLSPAMLTTEMKLVPISIIAKKLGQNYSSEIERATSLLFNSSLKYDPPKNKPNTAVPDSRDNTQTMEGTLKLQEMQQQHELRMNQVLVDMKKIELEKENLQQQRVQWEQEQKTKEQEWALEKIRTQQNLELSQQRNAEEQRRWEIEREDRIEEREKQRRIQELNYQTALAKIEADKQIREKELLAEIQNRPEPPKKTWFQNLFG